MDQTRSLDSLIDGWWERLTPYDRALIFHTRWDPLPEWVGSSLTHAGIPLRTSNTDAPQTTAHLPPSVQMFLDQPHITDQLATELDPAATFTDDPPAS